ncbi:alpha-hydroxy acid oxidase [Streptomyces sp. 5-10]|uniref:alpha-hydroxy acid oxidase n=1 Tax=Streptomyces sp. 5-10 TaxID=878925 RepID=UPI00168A939E|nr:alpha-hydroxy acid oxidase [Streptomyces sp. 5-10]MBD3009010.1 alpha-hydroxy-acid oxidizing protein [Streptomyces sp. 5-10]
MSAPDPVPAIPPVCAADAERLAAERLSPQVWDFIAGGSGDESVQAANRAALDRMRLVPRVLSAVPREADTSGPLLRGTARMPVAVAPMAYQRLLHPDGELATARAARDAGVPFVIPMLSSQPLERVAASGAVVWLQLYWLRDRGRMLELVRRAEHAGCAAVVVTVDVPFMGRRRRDLRNGFTLPPTVFPVHLGAEAARATHIRRSGSSALAVHSAADFDPSTGWADLAWLRDSTELPLVVKGVLAPRDAALAVEHGADAVVVSNHGGRQFAGAPASITALRPVVEEVAGGCAVLFDSGVRDGMDVLRALACGADGVMYGRPVLWGLAADGEAGVRGVLDLLRAELREALALSGCADVPAARRLTTVGL